jgi:2-oxoglutarate dehydrogenase E1 component
VKYHLGYSSDWTARNGHKIHLSLCQPQPGFNPVANGPPRQQDRVSDQQREGHGPAHPWRCLFAAGRIQETLNMSQLAAYTVGGPCTYR